MLQVELQGAQEGKTRCWLSLLSSESASFVGSGRVGIGYNGYECRCCRLRHLGKLRWKVRGRCWYGRNGQIVDAETLNLPCKLRILKTCWGRKVCLNAGRVSMSFNEEQVHKWYIQIDVEGRLQVFCQIILRVEIRSNASDFVGRRVRMYVTVASTSGRKADG